MITDTQFIESPEVRKSDSPEDCCPTSGLSDFRTPGLSDFPTSGLSDSLRQYIEGKSLYFACKRAFDISVSALVILFILSWLTPVLAILIKISSPGPVFFLQKRVGRFGRSFTCIKFRTMIVNAEADRRQATENDRRITGIGKFLRKSNTDELPQFFNVLMGHMSIVGPRPHMHADCYYFSTLIPRYKFRTLVKPGITGLSQIKGYHGQVISKECIFHRYQYDAYYVRHAGFWYDVRIVFTTAAQRIAWLFSLSSEK